ncbi:MAG TPA: translocation/assembly module TamB domain-containing protein, partial [Thermodesulfovibrionales bacterium]|nr:translocation/assembly module TamB domain-containing protein [Thermodesulfovibrionales bacterium]
YKDASRQVPRGRFDTAATMSGRGPRPLYKGIGRVSDASFGMVGVDSASFSFSYDYQTFLVEDALARKGDSTLSARGSMSNDDKFSLKVSAGKVYLKDIASFKGLPSDGYVTLRAELDGTVDNPNGKMDGVIHGGRMKDSDLGEGKLKASIKDKTVFVEMSILEDRIALSGKMGLDDEMRWTARLDVKPGRYDFLVTPWLREIPDNFILSMRGSADMWGDRNHFNARADIKQMNTTLYGNSLSNASDIRFEMKDRKIILSDVKFRSGTGSFSVSGDTEIGKEYNLVVEGSSSLAPLKGLSRRIDTMRGDAAFVFAVTGKWTDPRLDGGVTVNNAVFGLKDFAYRLSSVNGYFYMDGDRIVLQKISGKLGGGDAEISGVALLQGFALKRFYFNAVVSNIGVNVSKDFTANFDGGLIYTGTLESQTLNGEVRINRSTYRESVEWQSWLLRAKAKEKPRGEIGTFEKTNLNVKILGADDVLINNNIARASLKVDLVLRGTISEPRVFGRITTKTGIVFFRNNEFRILSATADFADPRKINPTMDIAAETTIQGYTIRMVLEGQMDHFTMSLSSTPSLEEIQILSLLTVGTLPSESKGIQGGIGANAAAAFLSGQLQNVAQDRLRSLTGIDRIGVEPYLSKLTGRSEQMLTVSKRLMGDRLSVTYSTGLGSAATNVVRMEYNIGNNIALIGERDEVGAFGGSVKFRFGFK